MAVETYNEIKANGPDIIVKDWAVWNTCILKGIPVTCDKKYRQIKRNNNKTGEIVNLETHRIEIIENTEHQVNSNTDNNWSIGHGKTWTET